jgi:hypothetical protein
LLVVPTDWDCDGTAVAVGWFVTLGRPVVGLAEPGTAGRLDPDTDGAAAAI